MVEAADLDQIFCRRKAISALLPYAILLGRDGHRGMADEILRVMKIPYSGKFVWRRLEAMLFAESSPSSFDQTIALVSPYLPWTDEFFDLNMVERWAAAASAVEFTEEVGQSLVDALLQIASNDSLRPRILDHTWGLLKNPVLLPPVCRGRSLGAGLDVVLYLRERGDVGILKSYYLLVWSEWNLLSASVVRVMETSIKEEFGGVGMWGHRKDLIERLNHISARLGRMSGHFGQEKPWIGEGVVEQAREQYMRLRDALVKIDMEAMENNYHSTQVR